MKKEEKEEREREEKGVGDFLKGDTLGARIMLEVEGQ